MIGLIAVRWCSECHARFEVTPGERGRLIAAGLRHLPRRCQSCRRARRAPAPWTLALRNGPRWRLR